MSYEYLPTTDKFLTQLLREVAQLLRDASLVNEPVYHDRITDVVLTKS